MLPKNSLKRHAGHVLLYQWYTIHYFCQFSFARLYIYVAEGYVWNEVSNVYRKCIRNNIKLLQGRKFDKEGGALKFERLKGRTT